MKLPRTLNRIGLHKLTAVLHDILWNVIDSLTLLQANIHVGTRQIIDVEPVWRMKSI